MRDLVRYLFTGRMYGTGTSRLIAEFEAHVQYIESAEPGATESQVLIGGESLASLVGGRETAELITRDYGSRPPTHGDDCATPRGVGAAAAAAEAAARAIEALAKVADDARRAAAQAAPGQGGAADTRLAA